MSWLEVDALNAKYNANQKSSHVYFYFYLTTKIYVMMSIWLVITYVLLLIFYFLVVKALQLDPSLFKSIKDGDRKALLRLVESEMDTSSNVLDVKKLTYLTFGSFLPMHFLKQHINSILILIIFTVIFSTIIAPFDKSNDSLYRKSQLKLFFLIFFLIFNITFLLTMIQK
jgi:hypothetical protein